VRGLNIHPDRHHIVYPLGCKVVVQNWKTKSQVFLSGHTNVISTIAVSPNGKYIASGQISYMGFKVSIDILNANSDPEGHYFAYRKPQHLSEPPKIL
jgi:WD40 repeat protein